MAYILHSITASTELFLYWAVGTGHRDIVPLLKCLGSGHLTNELHSATKSIEIEMIQNRDISLQRYMGGHTGQFGLEAVPPSAQPLNA